MFIMLKSGYFQMRVFYKTELNYCRRTLELSELNTFRENADKFVKE